MDLEHAIDAHLKWKVKLMSYFNDPNGSLDVATIERDDKCEFGQWMHSVKMKHGSDPDLYS